MAMENRNKMCKPPTALSSFACRYCSNFVFLSSILFPTNPPGGRTRGTHTSKYVSGDHHKACTPFIASSTVRRST